MCIFRVTSKSWRLNNMYQDPNIRNHSLFMVMIAKNINKNKKGKEQHKESNQTCERNGKEET